MVFSILKKFINVFPSFLLKDVKSPIFVIGTGRSGTTIFNSILEKIPFLAVFPYEANDKWHKGMFPWHQRKFEDFSPFWMDAEAFTRKSIERAKENQFMDLQKLLNAYQTMYPTKRVVIKSAMITFLVEEIKNIYPNAKFILLIRDGRPVCYSQARKQHQKIEKYSESYKEFKELSLNDLLIGMAYNWKNHIIHIEKLKEIGVLNNSNFITIKYEDLVINQELVIDNIFHHFDFPIKNIPGINVNLTNRNKNVENFKSTEEYRLITEIMSSELKLYNYL